MDNGHIELNNKVCEMKQTKLALALVASLITLPVMAYEEGDILFRAGVTNVSTNGSGDVFSGGADTTLDASAGDDTQVGLNFVYFLDSHIAVELLASSPFDHDIALSNGNDFASVKQLPPTLSVLYFFNDSQAKFQPYAGVGINYTVFFEEDLTNYSTGTLNATDLSLDNSWGLAAQVGFDYAVDDHWFVNGSIRYIDIDTTANFKLSGTDSHVDVDIDPVVSSLMLGYKF